MKTTVTLLMIGALALPMAAYAQSTTENSDQQPAAEQAGPPDVTQLMTEVKATADKLQTNVGNLGERIKGSANSAEEGAKLLDEMLTSAREVQASLDRDSEIWTQLNGLIDDWAKKRETFAEKAAAQPEFADIAEAWQKKIDNANALREQILVQAAESESLVDQIESRREVVLAYYELDAADKVLESMQAISDDLTAMNASMKGILDQTGVVAGVPVAQE